MARITVVSVLMATLGLFAGACAYATESLRPNEQNSSATLFEAAQRYEEGNGVSRDDAKAADLYCRAARLGNAEAAVRLGWIYANGRGVPQDDGIAAALFRHASGPQGQTAEPPSRLIVPESIRLPACMAREGTLGERDVARARPIVRVTGGEGTFKTLTSEPTAIDASAQIAAAISDWAAAWSARNVEKYLAAYAPNFRVPGGKSRAAWEVERRERILGKSRIAVTTEQIQINATNEKARAQFIQGYRADRIAQRNVKVLMLVKVDGRWLIAEEGIADLNVTAR
jgi:hypothetical protein